MTPPPTPSGDKDKPSPLPDEQVKPVFDIVSITKEIEEQSRQRVSQEDFNHYGTVIASYLQGNEQAIRDLPERLRPVLEALRPAQSPIVEHHARGGFVSTPTISTLAERGGEMVVPTADADRGLGISRLMEAARKLGVPALAAPEWDIPKLDIPALAAPEWNIPKLDIPAPAAPEWNIPKLGMLARQPGSRTPAGRAAAGWSAMPERGAGRLVEAMAPAAPEWDIPRLLESLKKTTPGTTSSPAPVSMPNINLSQTFTITGTDAQGIVEQFGPLTKQAVIEAMQEYQDEMRRVDYGT
ncbi:MAG: hypothetical protein IJU98_01870 [Synergistaceae bacterium]|nr:hypothetical protein [Synergistaceae bacterium]